MSSPALWYTTRATGIVALLLLTTTVALGVLTANRFSSQAWPRFAQQDIHKRISLTALVFVAIHVLTSIADTYVSIGWWAAVVPFTSHYDTVWVALGTVAVDLFLAVWVSSMLRRRIAARAWRALHWLAYFSWPVALAHAFGMGSDMREAWATAVAAACIAVVVAAVGMRVRAGIRRAAERGAGLTTPLGELYPPVHAHR